MAKKPGKESQTYQKMLEEVEQIVETIESSKLDVDDMASEIERGYMLIKMMRERLNQTKEKIEALNEKFGEE